MKNQSPISLVKAVTLSDLLQVFNLQLRRLDITEANMKHTADLSSGHHASGTHPARCVTATKRFRLCVLSSAAFLTTLISGVAADSLISNGDLEVWPASANPPAGIPAGWEAYGASPDAFPLRSPGLVADSKDSAWLQPGLNNGLSQLVAAHPTDFQVSFVVAAADPGSPLTRSLNFVIEQLGDNGAIDTKTDLINLRLVGGSTAGKLTLEAVDTDKKWKPIAEDAFDASVYDLSTHEYSTLNPYTIQVTYNSAANTYSVGYGPGKKIVTIIPDIVYFGTLWASKGIAGIEFRAQNSAAGFGISDVEATVPQAGGR